MGISAIPRRVLNDLRFAAARLRKGTVRYYCGNLSAFYAALHRAGISPLVLRWTDEVPTTPDAEALYSHDVDHLISDNTARALGKIAAQFPGPVKCDFYSVSGQSGSAYKGMPYYPPTLALQLLAQADIDPRGFGTLPPQAAFASFAYHLCYHKGLRSGIPLGLGTAHAPGPAQRDYAKELSRLAGLAGLNVVDPLTLSGLDTQLRDLGWGMPHDLMTRWPDQHPALRALSARQDLDFQKDKDAATGLTVFLIRADCEGEEMRELVRDAVGARFSILEHLTLDTAQQSRLMVQTRGGNWIEKYARGVVPPIEALICRNAPEPGPLPVGMSAEKVAERYPHVDHTDVLIKRDIRKEVNARLGDHANRVILHATDNSAEAATTLNAIYGAQSWSDLQER